MDEERSEGESQIDSDFEFDDDIKQSLDCLLNIPLEFESSSDEKEGEDEAEDVGEIEKTEERKKRDDSVERNLKALFAFGSHPLEAEDTGLENISDNELDGPESGECDSSDGELPDSPTLVRRVPNQGSPVHESDIELVSEYPRVKELQKVPKREGVVSTDPEKAKTPKKKKDKSPSKTKEKSLVKKVREKKDKNRKINSEEEDDLKNKLKVQKYLARIEQYRIKCIEYVSKISNKCDTEKKTEINNIKSEKRKRQPQQSNQVKIRSVVERVVNERETSPHSSTSSKMDQLSHSSRSSKAENASVSSKDSKQRRSSSNKERKSKSSKTSKTIPEDKHVLHYANYIKYLQSEREKCFEESNKKHKHKSKKKHKKRDSCSPEKVKEQFIIPNSETKVLTYDEFCKSRELSSPIKEKQETHPQVLSVKRNIDCTKQRTISVNSASATLTTARSEHIDDDTELFVTYSDLVEQDKRIETKIDEKVNNKMEEILAKDPEMKSISVFTSVLFKTDSNGIPFLQEGRLPSPKIEPLKPKSVCTQFSGPDDIYDCDDLSSISQSSLSPSRSPAPKIHNQALLNFLENQRGFIKQKPTSTKKSPLSKSSRSRSKSPKREMSKPKKRKQKEHWLVPLSPSPPPPNPKSPDIYKTKPSSPNPLKKRWKDYPSPPEKRKDYSSPPDRRKDYPSPPDRRKDYPSPPDRRKDHSSSPDRRKEYYERPFIVRRRSQVRVSSTSHGHRSRSSSEERYSHSRRHHYQSPRSRSRSRTPPPTTMVQTEKRRKLKEEHEKALASLRATVRKPMSTKPLSIQFSNEGDTGSFKPVMDNYELVGMNEDSSQSETETSPPLPPELPPELPPVPPSSSGAAPSEDLTVVTTYTSFLPITPPQHPPPPMGFIPPDMHSYNNWMGSNMPVRDMGPNMYGPPQYYSAPPQQQFPYLNQPPPHLPYQMQRYHHHPPPPHCHQRFRGPNQGPPPNMNFINVCQEINNVSPSPVAITQIQDSDNDVEILSTKDIPKPISNNKCKHNPLGQNNQTVQEAIDSVKKCLKNCDGVKSKDPRLAAVQVRSKSPEKVEPETTCIDKKSHPDETKVKITMNYKPRPVSSVGEVSCFEPEVEIEKNEKNWAVNELKTKINNYSDRSCKIEGIVSKLKDTIGISSKSDEPCRSQPSNEPEDLHKKATASDEFYDPFIDSEKNVQDSVQEESSISKQLEPSNVKSSTSTAVRELSPASVEKINHEIDETFTFIFSQSLERKRLTPTLDAIKAQKAEEQKKLHVIQTQPKQFPLLAQEKIDKVVKSIDPCGYEMNVQTDTNKDPKSQSHKSNIEDQLTHNPHELNCGSGVLDQVLQCSVLSEKTNINLNVQTNLKDLDTSVDETTNRFTSSESDSKSNKTSRNELPYFDTDLLQNDDSHITVDYNNDSGRSHTKILDDSKQVLENKEKSKNDTETNKRMCKETALSKHKIEKTNLNKIESKIEIKPEVLKKRHGDSEIYKKCDAKEHLPNPTQSSDVYKSQHIPNFKGLDKTKDDSKTDKERNLASSQIKNKNEGRLFNSTIRNEYFQSSLKNGDNNESRCIPCLSIPTKGELKGFPSPERISPKETKLNPDSKASNTTDVQKKDKSKIDISKMEMEEQIVKPCHSKTVVESILNDFEDSSSAGSDFQEIRKGKEIVVVQEKENLNALKRLDIKERNPTEHYNKSGVLSTDVEISKPNNNAVSSLACFDEINIQKEKTSQNKSNVVKSEKYLPNENVPVHSDCDFRKKQRKSIKSEIITETTCEDKKVASERTRGGKGKSENYLDLTTENKDRAKRIKNEFLKTGRQVTSTNCRLQTVQDSNYQDGSSIFNDIVYNDTSKNEQRIDNEDEDLQLLLAKPPVSLDHLCKLKPKPGPLSKKSKSYILKHLPVSFDLSVDGHLIQRGFRKLKVQVTKLESGMSPQIENSSSSEDANIEGFESGLQYNASSFNTNVTSLNKIDQCYVKELGTIKSKENKKDRSKKKVSFDMNVSEIILKSEQFQIDGENSQNSAFKINVECKASDCSQDTVDVNIKHDIGGNLPINSHIAPTTTDKDMVLEDPHMSAKSNQIGHIPKPDKDEICDISVYNMRIMDSLNSFRARPLTQMQNTKCLVITIPLEEDMPKAKIRDHQKKTLSLKSSKKPNNQRTLKDFSNNESKSLRNMLPSVRDKLETLRNPAQLSDARVCEIKRNNNTQSSEQNESDMEDSFILDRELSDLAKVCLDSDSTVGGDDDSVLNFGIAASDDSSVDNEFYSKVLPINQTKLSSPLNIKKRFTRKLKSLGIDVNIQKLKSATASNMKKLQNYANDEKVLKSQEKLSINEQEKRKSKRGRKQEQDTSNMQITLIDNRSGSTEVSKGNIEESVISKEVLTSCKISGFESLKVKNTELDTVIQGSSCKLHEKDVFKGEIANLKSNITINSTEEGTMCNKTEPSLSITCNEDVADNMSRIEMAEGSSIPLQPQISDIDDESKDSISPLRRVCKMKINDKDAIFSNEHISSFHEKCEGKTSLNCNSSNDETNLPEISFTRKNLKVKNDENPNDIDCIKDIEKGKIVEELEFEGKKNYNANKRMLIEINVEEESLKHRMQKRKLTEVSDCYDPGSSEVIAIDDVCKTKKEKLLRKKNFLIDIGHTLELNCSSKKGKNNLGEEPRKSKHTVTGSLHKSENLRQTRSKSQRRSEKVDIVENSNTPIIPLDTVKTVKKCLKQTRSDNLLEEKIDGNNTFSTENIVKLDTNKTKDNKIICKKVQPISRTFSTESFDEPLITLKNKLLAGENEEKFHKDITVCNFVEESKLVLKQNNNLVNSEECKNKLETPTTVSSNSTGQYNSVNNSQIEKIKEEEIKTVPNLEFLPTNVSNSDKSYPDSLRTSSEDSILSIETSTNKSLISNSHGNDVEYSVSPELNLSVFKCNIAVNPMVKGSLRKKRDKAEVDAEIKRRLAEIDELEKIATTQHATVLEKIGARTRSKTVLKLAKSTDDVQACCEDSQEKKCEVQKSISITGEATKKAVLSMKSQVENCSKSCKKEKSKTNPFHTNPKFPENFDAECIPKAININATYSVETSNTLDKTVIKSIEEKSCENDSMSPDSNEDQVCDKPNKELNCSTSVTARKKGKQAEKTKLCENIAEESRTLSKDLLTSPGEQTRRTRRNVASAYKLRDKNDDPESLVCTKIPNCNRSIGKQSIDVYEETNKTPFLSISENSVSLGSIRKTRNKSSMYEAHSVKSSESSRESSPSNQVGTILSEYSPKYVTSESKLNKTALSSTITEPDSSTPTVDSYIGPVSPSMHKCIPETMKRKNENGTEYISPVESTLSDMSLEPDTVESSAMTMNVFRHPLRNTVLNRNRRRRRAFEETRFSALSHSTPRASETDSLHGCNEQDKCLSEGIVSSSVNTIPTCDLKKKRRKRKSFVDLLMDDSMLSVTRDFPMSPNPYILPSFDKELEISSNKTQLTNLCDSDKTINELADTNSLPPRPDILAQKLRILEKLKNINRKNRKTRQCRTLVCYNEDSLPESLVESPVSEGVPQNSDSEMSSQDLTLTKDDEKEQSSLIQISESVKEDMTNNSCKKKVKADPKLFVLRKRGRKSASFSNQFPKATKNNIDDSSDVKTLKDEKGLKRYFEEDTSNSDESLSYDMGENYSSLNMAVETNDTNINSNQTSDKQKNCSDMEEPSEFDKLLQSSSNKAKLNFKFDHNLRLSPMEGKSYHSSIDFFETYTSCENKDDTNENDINCGKKLSELPKNFQPNSVKEVFCSMSNAKLFQERILCSILKVKIGKMLPLFGDSSSSEEDLDEDIPLFVKLSQTYQNRLSPSEKTKNITIDKSINIATKEESLVKKKRGRKPKVSVPTSSPNRYEDQLKLGGFEVFSDVKNKSVSIKENKELDKVFDYCDESIVSNPESRPLLRKSNRKPRSLQASNEEKSINNLERLNIVEAALNETASNMPLCSETSQNKIDKSNYLEKQIIPVRKRGRPRKIKHPDQKYDSDPIPKEDSQKDKLEIELSVLQYETKPYNTIKEDCLNTQTSRIKEQLSYSPDENLIASLKDGEIGGLESTFKDHKFSQNLPSDNEDSGQLIEDSVNKNQETLPKTRAKHAKFTQNKQDLGDEIINNLDNAVSFTDFEKTSVDTKSAAVEGQIVKRRWQRGKWPRRQLSTMIHSINNVGDCDAVEDSKASDIEDVESLLETPLNDLPPPLVKTRSRRPRNSTLDSFNSDPPLLETPFQLNVDEDKSMDSNNINSKSAQEMNIVLMNKKRGRKPKKDSDLFKGKNIVNSDSYTDTSPSLNKISGSSYNYKECDLKTEENYKTAKETVNEKQVCTRKRGRRSKFSITQKEESDSEIKSSICPITKTKLLCKNEGEEEIVSNSAITDSNSNTNNDNTVTSSFHREANENKTTNSSETIQDKNSFKYCKPKLKRKQINPLSDDQAPYTNETSSKQFKTKEDDVDVEDSSSPNAPSNIYQDTTSNTSYGCTNQAFLWSKISGFLNKTTRSVGTQVKIKNMALKGFESSEPEVSLQSEMTLPQVIKTLFEELKTTDSSFSDL